MKKKLGITIFLLVVAVSMLSACSEKEEEIVPYNYDLSEYVKIGDYHNLPYIKQTAEITDEDVEKEIAARLQYAASVENSTTGVVEDGDTINIAFSGRIDGELFDGGSSESYDLTVGTTPMIDGFVEGLVGKNVGDTVTLDLQFPEEYHSDAVAGKPVVFEVTINSKRVVSVPEFNDEFVQATSEFQTTDEYKSNLKDALTKQAQDSMDASIKDALWEVIVTGSEALKYPEQELAEANSSADDMESDYQAQAVMYGWEWEEFLDKIMRTDAEGFAKMKEEYAQNMVLSDMVLYKMARDENVSISQSEFETRVKEILDASSYNEDTFQASFGMTIFEYAETNGWRNSFLLEKLMDKVIEYGREVSEEEFETYVNEALGIEEVPEEEHGHDHDHDHEGEEGEEGAQTGEGEEEPVNPEPEGEAETETEGEAGAESEGEAKNNQESNPEEEQVPEEESESQEEGEEVITEPEEATENPESENTESEGGESEEGGDN